MEALVNRVSNSGLMTIKLESLVPEINCVNFDLAPHLWKGLALKEKEFRQAMKSVDWSNYEDKVLCLYCSTDAIIPMWAYMLISCYAASIAKEIYVGSVKEYEMATFLKAANELDITPYIDKRVILKGCTDGRTVGAGAYARLASRLQPIVQSLMFGEPCSTVPIYKRKRMTK